MVVSFTSRRPYTYAMQERENVPAMHISSTGPNSQSVSPGIRYPVLQTDRDGLSPVNISHRGDDTEAIGQESSFRRKAGSEGTGVKHSKQNDKKKTNHHVPIVCADTSLTINRPFSCLLAYRRARKRVGIRRNCRACGFHESENSPSPQPRWPRRKSHERRAHELPARLRRHARLESKTLTYLLASYANYPHPDIHTKEYS